MMFDYPCPKCGGRTYTYGDPLPGQPVPARDRYDDRERENIACVNCGWTSERKAVER